MNLSDLDRLWKTMALVATASAGLTACGGGGGETAEAPLGPATEAKLSESGSQLLTPTVLSSGIPATEWKTQGAWSPVLTWGESRSTAVLAQHAIMVPDGRVLSFGADYDAADNQRMVYSVWDPKTNTHVRLPNGTDVNAFCAAQIVLPQSGNVSILGGEVRRRNVAPDGTVYYDNFSRGNPYAMDYNPSQAKLTQSSTSMNRARWYATPTMMLDGEVFIQGGMVAYGADRDPTFPSFANSASGQATPAYDPTNITRFGYNANPANNDYVPQYAEVRTSAGQFQELTDAKLGEWLDWYYPRNWLLPDNTVFGMDATGKFFRVDARRSATGSGGIVQFTASLNDSDRQNSTPPRAALGFGLERSQTSVMYDKNKVLGLGGATTKSFTVDLSGISGTKVDPTARPTVEPVITESGNLSAPRRWSNATVLPDGKVVVTGGAAYDPSTDLVYKGAGDAAVSATNGVTKYVELWDPATGKFTKGASERYSRLYHSTAMLLPDGTVLSAGGGFPGPRQPWDRLTPFDADKHVTDAQIYFPPYLFKADGTAADRPVIYSAPTSVAAGTKFSIRVGSTANVDRVVLIKTASVTHSYNFEQRLLKPTFAVGSQTGELVVTLPGAEGEPASSKVGDTPPGYYMVFVLDKAGVPSIAKIMRIEPLSSAQVAALSSHALIKGARYNPGVFPGTSTK